MSRIWKTIKSKSVYKNQWIEIQEDAVVRPDGNDGIYAFLKKRAGVWIIALDESNNVYLIKEFRYPIKRNVIQIPCGFIDSEDLVENAKKELFEETGIKASKWEMLGGFYQGPGHETTYGNAFLAEDLDLSGLKTANQEGNESIAEIIKVSLPELKKIISEGKIECGMTLAALNLFFLKK